MPLIRSARGRRRGPVEAVKRAAGAKEVLVPRLVPRPPRGGRQFLFAVSGILGDRRNHRAVQAQIRKIAVGYCQCEAEQAQEISDLISAYETGHKGISRRNRSKLQAFTPERIQQFVCVSDRLIADVHSQAESLKRQQRKKTDFTHVLIPLTPYSIKAGSHVVAFGLRY